MSRLFFVNVSCSVMWISGFMSPRDSALTSSDERRVIFV